MAEPLRLLVADDHPLLREGVVQALAAECGWQVVADTGDGDAALALAARTHPDVALLDLSMPGTCGAALIGAMASAHPRLRIVVLTASADTAELLAALEAGAHGYVLKGVSASELRAVVRQVAAGEQHVPPALAGRLLMAMARPADRPLGRLTPRESEVLRLLARGRTNHEIGNTLHIADKTVKHHVTQILGKLGLRSRTEAALWMQRQAIDDAAHGTRREAGAAPAARTPPKG